jgi:hypothetical protein
MEPYQYARKPQRIKWAKCPVRSPSNRISQVMTMIAGKACLPRFLIRDGPTASEVRVFLFNDGRGQESSPTRAHDLVQHSRRVDGWVIHRLDRLFLLLTPGSSEFGSGPARITWLGMWSRVDVEAGGQELEADEDKAASKRSYQCGCAEVYVDSLWGH